MAVSSVLVFFAGITDAATVMLTLQTFSWMNTSWMSLPGTNKQFVIVVTLAVQAGVPVPTFSAAITYLFIYRSEMKPSANLIQAQRDYFGAYQQ